MPQLVKKLGTADYRRRGAGTPRLDLSAYRAIIAELALGEGAEVALEAGEMQRVVKRRFTMAAAERGQAMKWRTPIEPGNLRFELVPKERAKGAGAARL